MEEKKSFMKSILVKLTALVIFIYIISNLDIIPETISKYSAINYVEYELEYLDTEFSKAHGQYYVSFQSNGDIYNFFMSGVICPYQVWYDPFIPKGQL